MVREAPSSWAAQALADASQLHAEHTGSGSRPRPSLYGYALTVAMVTPELLDCLTWSTGEPQSHKAWPWSVSTKEGPIPPVSTKERTNPTN